MEDFFLSFFIFQIVKFVKWSGGNLKNFLVLPRPLKSHTTSITATFGSCDFLLFCGAPRNIFVIHWIYGFEKFDFEKSCRNCQISFFLVFVKSPIEQKQLKFKEMNP